MINDILEAKLAANGFEVGKDLFRDHMPADCSIGVMTKVPLQGIPIDPNMRGIYKGRMQVVVRHKEPDLGAKMAALVQQILQVEGRELHEAVPERGAVHLDIFFPETTPIRFPRLDGNGYEWSQHFKCVFGMKAATI
jgi:hypothetical protein